MANPVINVAIKEGWAGGPNLTQLFRQAVTAAGYNITDPKHADVLIVHGTACFDIDTKSPVRRYIIIDPPYWPGKTLVKCLLDKELDEKRLKEFLNDKAYGWKYLLKKTGWEAYYIFAKPRYTLLAFQNFGKLDFLNALKDKQVVLVRNEKDDLCSRDIETTLNSYKDVFYVQLPGGHDDYMSNPQPYIDLLPEGLL